MKKDYAEKGWILNPKKQYLQDICCIILLGLIWGSIAVIGIIQATN